MLRQAFEEHAAVLDEMLASQLVSLQQAAEQAERCLHDGGRILVFGNGGSAADAQHFAAELVGRFERDRDPLSALALTVNTSTLSAVANDYGFATVFSRQLEAIARQGDLVIAISTSGDSPNVVEAAKKARHLGCAVIGLTGAGGGELASWVDVLIAVPSTTVSRIQEMHELCLHALAGWLERRMFPVEDGREER